MFLNGSILTIPTAITDGTITNPSEITNAF